MSLATELREAAETGSFWQVIDQIFTTSISDPVRRRNLVALIMLHAAATNYPLDVPRCVDTAFKLADGYLKKCGQTTESETCAGCQKPVPAEEAVWIDPVTTQATMTGKPYHVGCAPEQKE
jgi:hypothetical protein